MLTISELKGSKREALLDRIDPLPQVVDMDDLNESIEDLQGKLVTALIPAEGKTRQLLEKKTALLGDIAQFQKKRDSSMGMNSKKLANDLYLCKSHKALVQRLDREDVPVVVRNELKAKLNKVK